jgi:integrase
MEDEVRLANKNPVTKEKFALIGSVKFVKPPLNPKDFDVAAQAIEDKRDRAWFDVTRYTGMRKDEANRLQWLDVNWELARIRIPGTKTEESEVWLPLAPAALETLRALYDSEDRDPNCEYAFPGRSAQTKGKKIYSRRRIFERIQRVTAVKRYMQQNPAASYKLALEACKKEKFKGGLHLKPKDLRDYFGTQIAGKVADATVVMRLMRHTSLDTTTKYMRTVDDRMTQALDATFGRNSVSRIGPKTASAEVLREFEEFLQWKKNRNKDSGLRENFYRNFSGGGQIRTVDAADMSRVL